MDLLSLEKWTSIDDCSIINYFSEFYDELLILKTCNRFEIYIVPKKDPSEIINSLFLKYGKARILYDMDAVRHIIEVSSGMDSMIPGEHDIQRQVKEALNSSIKNNISGKILNYVFMNALNISKIIRSETKIGNGITSIPQAAVRILNENMKSGNVGLIGTGKVAHSVLKYLSDRNGEYQITVFGRNMEKLRNIKNEYHVMINHIENIFSEISEFDAIISAITVQEPILRGKDFVSKEPSLIIDLGNPRNIENLNDRKYIDLEYIKSYVERNIIKRKDEMIKADKIIDEKILRIENKILSMEIEEIIQRLFERANKIKEEEIKKSMKILGEDSRDMLEIYGNSLIKKIYSNLINNLKSRAKNLTEEEIELIKGLLGE
ncbi:MAG: NAD(P)-binding domain-containing protein [Thermoplasmata archaeon]